jgi:hypothetical protein
LRRSMSILKLTTVSFWYELTTVTPLPAPGAGDPKGLGGMSVKNSVGWGVVT